MFRDMFMSDPVGFYLEQVDYLRSYLSTLWSMTFEIELKTMLPMSSLVLYIVLYSSLPVVVLYHFFQTQATQQTIIQRVEKLEVRWRHTPNLSQICEYVNRTITKYEYIYM